MKWFILIAVIFSNSFEAEAAKPLPPADQPFTYTVEAYVNGNKVGKNLQWTKKWTYQESAYELWSDVPALFPNGSHVRFLVEWPRRGYASFDIYGCVEDGVLRVVNRIEDC